MLWGQSGPCRGWDRSRVLPHCAQAPRDPSVSLARPVSSHCVLLTLPPSQCAHGFNVFITCLTRCLIASPLNGAVTVETRNKRPPENEMIKQVTLAKQTPCSHSPGCVCSFCPGKCGAGWERAGGLGQAPGRSAPPRGASSEKTGLCPRGMMLCTSQDRHGKRQGLLREDGRQRGRDTSM